MDDLERGSPKIGVTFLPLFLSLQHEIVQSGFNFVCPTYSLIDLYQFLLTWKKRVNVYISVHFFVRHQNMKNIHTASQQLFYTESQISGNDSRKIAYEKLVIYCSFTISSKMNRQ